ncbi:MAG: ABC-type antimicrobial peptide transport system, ATPase component [Cyanobacteria bacterium RYN_339]|nr:ABC-type antimicrobial peptide transport system, ATPase component [Cyanobacteria bacterium RYN_339]
MAMIQLQDLYKIYRNGNQEIRALNGVSLEIAEGEFVAIMGTSGSGKSTMMNIIGCLDRPSEGHYLLDGLDITNYLDDDLARVRNRKLGFVFQSFNLLARTSAVANVELPLIYASVKPAERRRRATLALERVGLGQRLDHKPNELSGGQQQRVSIARAIVTEPRLLLADEPTGALDSRTTEEIMDLFLDLNAGGMTVVMVTHEPDVAQYAKRIVRFRDGQILSDEINPAPRGKGESVAS